MPPFKFFHHHHRGYGHDKHHGGKFGKFDKPDFITMLRRLELCDLSNPQDPNVQEQMRLIILDFFETRRFIKKNAGREMEGEKNIEENIEASGSASEEDKGKESEENCGHCRHYHHYFGHHHHHHRGYGRKHHDYECGKCQGRFSGDESSSGDDKGRWKHHRRHGKHFGWHGDGRRHHRHHGREIGWKNWYCIDATVKNADSGSQESNREVSGNDMQVEPAKEMITENLGNEVNQGKNPGEEQVQEVAETLRKSSLE